VDDLQPFVPRNRRRPGSAANHRADVKAVPQQTGDEIPADEAAGTGDEDRWTR
jgi:hypothetical protein